MATPNTGIFDAASAMQQVQAVGQLPPGQDPAMQQQGMPPGQAPPPQGMPPGGQGGMPMDQMEDPMGQPPNVVMSEAESLEAELEAKYSDAASPEEQDIYDQFMLRVADFLYQGNKTPKLIKMLEAGQKDPSQAIGDAASTIVAHVDEDLGGNMPRDVLMPALGETVEQIAELAMQSNALPVNQQIVQLATDGAMSQLMQLYQADEKDMQDFEQIVEPSDMARAGALTEKMLAHSGMGQKGQGQGQPSMPPGQPPSPAGIPGGMV